MMENMVVLPETEKPVRLSRLMPELLPDFQKGQSWSIKGQYTHPKYSNDWVKAIRIEARELTNAGYAYLKAIYRGQAVNRTVIVVHLCDLLKDDLEVGDEAIDDFENTVQAIREYFEANYGWVDVRPTSQLLVSRDGLGLEHKPELPEMHSIVPSGDISEDRE